MIFEYEAKGKGKWYGKMKEFGEKPVAVLLCPL
jgi:hypothetical protein